MRELEFSYIGAPSEILLQLLKEFETQHHAHVNVRYLEWPTAWRDLLGFALYGQGPDVSHIGSTWATSLVSMNALRPFTSAEIAALGGAGAFLESAWQSVTIPGSTEIWSLPWRSYTFILCYRRDLLQSAGLDEATAFQTAEAFDYTLARMQTSGVDTAWALPTGRPVADKLHYIASWVWGAGGDYVSDDGRVPLFTRPEARAGLKAYFDLFRHLSPIARRPDLEQGALLAQGRAAVALLGVDAPYMLLKQQSALPEVLTNLGVAPLPGKPWTGGANLVVWQHPQTTRERERLAVQLASFLASARVQQAYLQDSYDPDSEFFPPTQIQALAALPFSDTLLTQTVTHALQTGRAHKPIALWGVVEHQLSAALGKIGDEVLAGSQVNMAIAQFLEPLALRLPVTFRQ